MRRIIQKIVGHFARLEACGKWPFFWRAWLGSTATAFLVGNAAQLVFPAAPRSDLASLSLVQLIALVALIGPLFETLAFQCFPSEVTSRLGFRRSIRLAVSIVPFALMHHFAGVPTVVAAGIVGGFYFAFTYERWRKESIFAGVMMTFLLHSSYNLSGVLAMFVFHR